MPRERTRLDVLLVNRGLVPTRERARAAIMAGLVFVNGGRADKPGMMVQENDAIQVKGEAIPYVSRGGLKLEKALAVFTLDLADKTVIDVGASTGGFTDCALKHGATRVYAIDVGYGQLAWSLRHDPRVVVMERTNIRHVTPEQIGAPVDVITVDVAFISLAKVLPVAAALLRPGGAVIALIKPQFEAGRDKVGKKGVVHDPAVHREVIADVIAAAQDSGLAVKGLTYSPITGPEGNIEYLAYFINGAGPEPVDIDGVVAAANKNFK